MTLSFWHRKLAMCNFYFLVFKMFSNLLDIRLVISVVIECVNLNKMNVYVKKLKIKRPPVHWFGLTELNEIRGIMFGRSSSET